MVQIHTEVTFENNLFLTPQLSVKIHPETRNVLKVFCCKFNKISQKKDHNFFRGQVKLFFSTFGQPGAAHAELKCLQCREYMTNSKMKGL